MSEPLPQIGVSVPFWAGAIELLVKLHGDKVGAPSLLNQLSNHLAHAEALYKTLPEAPPKPKQPRKSPAMIANAEELVRRRYANVFVEQKGQKFRIIQRQVMGRPVHLSSLCTTEASAWNQIAKRIR